MFAKVVAGVLAAVAVAGVGVYVALPETYSCHSCTNQRALENVEISECKSCCMIAPPISPEAPNESLAACGGSALIAATAQPAPTCCAGE